MIKTPVDTLIIDSVIEHMKLPDFGQATIREVVAVASKLEQITGTEFIRMEMGVPGLPPSSIGVEAEIKALKEGVASTYPLIEGLPILKQEASHFIKAFIDIDVAPQCCIPVVGSMQGSYTLFLLCCQCDKKKDTILFIDPGFPVQKQQIKVMGYRYESFDVYDFRGDKLHDKLESFLKQGNIAGIVYSNPNNPSWICLNEAELQTIGQLATKYNTIVLEDLAYFMMDFRKNLSVPFLPPFQPSVARYTDNYVLLISASKLFSYAGQRIGLVAISNKLYNRLFTGLTERYGSGTFGSNYIQRVLYATTSGVSHSTQYALAAMFKEAYNGHSQFLESVKEYGRRAKLLKEIFLKYGFEIVYDKDLDEPIADGFYFTIGYPGKSSGELMKDLLHYGISAISLMNTGSLQEGIRACTSFIKDHQYEILDARLMLFQQNNNPT